MAKSGLRHGLRGCLGIILGVIIVGIILFSPLSAYAATDSTQVKVATRLIPPFVMEEKGKLTGFSIDLWKNLAAKMGVTADITTYPTLPTMLSAVDEKKADLAIAAISITAERNQKYDFSMPIYTAGLQILVRSSHGGTPNLIRDLFSSALLQLLGLALVMVVVASHIIWLLERKHPSTSISKHYIPGIFEAAWWAAATLATQAEEMPKGPLGRIMAIIWMFTAVIFVAYFTATVTTGMTVQQLQGDIQGLKDLKGRVVATTTGSTAADFLRDRKIQTLEVDKINAAYEALSSQKVDAVVFDAPVLMYYAANEGAGNVQLVGDTFRPEDYGILLPAGSPLRKRIDTALLKLREDGTYQALYDQWFKPKS
jgi:polar amino acid transport system substrate-binding protein